ncbi:hypothetical protein Aasi_0583 [Candidatus Amoebophilus asiaticus 5a2]|uniref:Outer membrane protein beta-barrel domain-containing protein n=1 Tax=Amoebophilus asiaticus (strain 5a2) TaxID=452471 RepID=B3ERY2_AMOA5|nr:outer membrane beta-barrel protein [Candidatus Amoebophilus asiaticus]ACE05984.1 hypothetical protein Aasi_0583 [Candidatus Amoebophilus asiaticus 5a2]
MKRILLALASAFTITLSASTYAAAPLSFGIKLSGVNSTIAGLKEAKNPFAGNESNFLNIGGAGLAYVEYAFNDNLGLGLEAGYFFGKIGSFTQKTDKKNTYNITAHGVKLFPAIKIYPMGREDENGILKINVGGDLFMPLGLEGKASSADKADVADKGKDLTTLGMGAFVGVGYEFPFGLELDLRGSYAFTNVFKEESDFKKTYLGITNKDHKTNLMNINLTAGYNFAVLLEE